MVEEHSDLTTQENFTLEKEWHLKKSSKMNLPREAWKEDSLDPGPKELSPGSDTQAAPSGMTEEPVLSQVTYASSYNPSYYTRDGDFQLWQSHQVIHSNSVQKLTDINLDSATLDSPSG